MNIEKLTTSYEYFDHIFAAHLTIILYGHSVCPYIATVLTMYKCDYRFDHRYLSLPIYICNTIDHIFEFDNFVRVGMPYKG